MNFSKTFILAVGLGFLLAACSDETTSSPFEPNVTNLTDTFAVQAGALTNVSTTQIYTWQNPGPTADVGQSGTVTRGSAALTVMDADGIVVYSSDLMETGTFQTSAGIAGVWTVQLTLSGYSGDIDFSLQTP